MGRLMDCMSSGRLVGARGCCCEKETIAQCAYAAGADRKNARGVSDTITDLREGAEDDGARGGKLV